MPANFDQSEPAATVAPQDFILAFSDTAPAIDHVGRVGEINWRVHLVTHQSLVLLIADVHRLGIAGIRLHPGPDGTGGTEVPLSELMR